MYIIIVLISFFQYIREFYNEDPEKYNKECTDVDQLRQVSCFYTFTCLLYQNQTPQI